MATKKKTLKTPTPSAQVAVEAVQSELLHLDPASILIGDNIRFGLKQDKLASLSADILNDALHGGPGVHVPIEVEALTAAEKVAYPGKDFRLITGEYRLTSVQRINANGGSLAIPAFVFSFATPLARLNRQIAENNQRENLSYMDISFTIGRLLDLNVSRIEIRNLFPRLTGKGKLQSSPASNAWVNKVRAFADFPKKIQDLIHNGVIGYQVAVDLHDKPKEKWDAIVQDILMARERREEKEQKADDRELAKAGKIAKDEEKKNKMAEALKEAKALVSSSAPVVTTRTAELTAATKAAVTAYNDSKAAKTKEEKAKAAAALAEAEKNQAAVKAIAEAAERTHMLNNVKLKRAQDAIAAAAKREAEKLNPPSLAVPVTPPAPAPISAKELAQASSRQGATDPVARPYKATDMREIAISIRKLSDPNTQKKTCAIGELLLACFDGKLGTMADGADAKVQNAIAQLFGELRK